MIISDKNMGERMRETDARFYGLLKQNRQRMKLARFFTTISAPDGKFKIGDPYPKGEVEDAKGSPTVNTIDSASKEYKTKPRRWTCGINYHDWRTSNARTNGEVDRAMRMGVNKLLHDMAVRCANMLKTGEVATDLFETSAGAASPFFDDDPKFIPGTSKGFVNLFEADIGDSAKFRNVLLDVVAAAFDEMEGTLGFMHDMIEDGAKLLIAVPPALRRRAIDALLTAPGSTVIGGREFGFDYVVEPLLGEAHGGEDDEFYVGFPDATFPPLVWGETGSIEIRSTFGENLSRILFDGDLLQPYYAGEFGYAASFNVIKVKHTE